MRAPVCFPHPCRYDVVVDIGGGNGQFLAALLSKHPQLRGVLVDQQGQVERGQQVRGSLSKGNF
jgi:tRNA G46 methylase TrmB